MPKIFVKIVTIIIIAALTLSFTAAVTEPFELPFDDVHSYDWFYNAVVWAYEYQIMNGVSATLFQPHIDMTRAMLVTVLWRYAGMPDAGESAFDDVDSGRWYSTAVAWAYENAIVTGHSASIFGTNEPVNREQMYTILYRYMHFANLTIPIEDEERILKFADENDISDWAVDAMYFMNDAGIMFMLSTMDISARPKDNAFRGEIAAAMFFFDMRTEPLSIIYE